MKTLFLISISILNTLGTADVRAEGSGAAAAFAPGVPGGHSTNFTRPGSDPSRNAINGQFRQEQMALARQQQQLADTARVHAETERKMEQDLAKERKKFDEETKAHRLKINEYETTRKANLLLAFPSGSARLDDARKLLIEENIKPVPDAPTPSSEFAAQEFSLERKALVAQNISSFIGKFYNALSGPNAKNQFETMLANMEGPITPIREFSPIREFAARLLAEYESVVATRGTAAASVVTTGAAAAGPPPLVSD